MNNLQGTVDHGVVIEAVAGLLEWEEFRLLEMGMRMVAKRVLSEFPPIQKVIVTTYKLRASIDREVAMVSVGDTLCR